MNDVADRPKSRQRTRSAVETTSAAELFDLYAKMQLLRRFELAAQVHFKKGELPGFIHLYVGQEAVAVGVCAHLGTSDWITSTHRGHGHALAKGTDPRILMAELFGKATGCCGGRGGSMHLYDPGHGVYGTNGIVAAGIPHAVGAALSARARGTSDIGVAFFGDGATSHGAFHESLSFAAAQRAPSIFVCENNLYATATPLASITANADIASRAAAYGIPGIAVDGNDVLAVRAAAGEAIARARVGEGPTLIEAKTYRFVGHHEGEPIVGTYRTKEELEAWQARCPILTFRECLLRDIGPDAVAELNAIDARVDAIIRDALDYARTSPLPDPESILDHCWSDPVNPPLPMPPSAPAVQTQGWLDAVRDGIAEEMRRDPYILYLGEGTGERGGSFAHTKGLWQEFGPGRMIDTPICELGFTGAAIGASATGARTIADLMFGDFIFETGCQLPLQASKLRYMSGGRMAAPVIIRAGVGAIKSAGPHHSGMYHSMWGHLPGLVVALPSNPADAKGLIKTALRNENPVLFLEPKALFASKGPVPTGEHFVSFGQARIARPGSAITVVAAGRMVPMALEAAELVAREGIECEIIDLRTIAPLDLDTVMASVAKTHRLLIVDEGYPSFGVGAEIAAAVNELAFDELDGPVARLHTDPIPHPFSPTLEQLMLPTPAKIVDAVRASLRGEAHPPRRAFSLGCAAPANGTVAPPPQAATIEQAPAHAGADASPTLASGEVFLGMPHGDLTVSEGQLVRWFKAVGDNLAIGDVVAEIETDKAIVEVEALDAGRLIRILVNAGDTIKMGDPLAIIATADAR
ncbi:2-oxoisovalerate dehydrogenase E1 component [Bradyrhizobium sp. S3.12.5]|uniref:thiamine pyrophosphate-dependent enzyme n=1 Tax=Bradyrhizobium sp. S3.12.5 TaxID=3156386 RepID=UPI0033956AC0